jgi:DNA-binding LytR/AlgR family response regulator
MVTILIVEDDFLNRRLMKKVLLESGYKIYEAKNRPEALEVLKSEKIDFAILDINLGNAQDDGILLGSDLSQKFDLPFIYLSGYDNNEVLDKAVATAPYTYLTKPFRKTDLIAAIELGIKKHSVSPRKKPCLLLRDDDFSVEVPIEDICFVEADKNYLKYHTDRKIYKSRSTIKQLLAVLPLNTFVQTHRAFVVNRNKINKFNIRTIVVNDVEIPISRTYVDELVKMLK